PGPFLTTTKRPPTDFTVESQSHALRTRCLRFVTPVPGSPRKTRFPLLATLRDGIGYPQDSAERFPSCFLHLFLPSQACLAQGQGELRVIHPVPFAFSRLQASGLMCRGAGPGEERNARLAHHLAPAPGLC